MRWAGGMGAALLALTGCVSSLPLPLTPVQFMFGGWPPKGTQTTSVARNYAIKGDTFTIPNIGLALTRANDKDWEFQATSSGVALLSRDFTAGTDPEPRPSLQVSVIPLPEGTVVSDALVGDQLAIIKAGGGVTSSAITIDGVQGESWIISQTDATTKLETRTWRVYLVHEGQIILVQGLAAPDAFFALLPTFESMVMTLRVPNSPNAPQSATETVKSVPFIRSDETAVPNVGLSFKPLDPGIWLVRNQGATTVVEARALPVGALARPALTVTVGEAPTTTFLADELKRIQDTGVTVAVSEGTVDGKTGAQWDWTFTQPGAAVGLTTRRITIVEGTKIALVEAVADSKLFPQVEPSLEALIQAVKLPQPAPAATP